MYEQSFGSIMFTIFLILFWPIFWGGLYVIMFRENPFGNPMNDLRNLNEALIKMKQEEAESSYDEDDYWEYEDGEAHTHTGPTIRHPKNRDRAHSGGA